jgi:hypothetical protein
VIGAVRFFISRLLSRSAGCPHCGSADLRLSQRPTPFARLGIERCRCRDCHRHFLRRTRRMLVPQEPFAEDVRGGGHERGRHARRHHRDHTRPAAETQGRPPESIDLGAVERRLAEARARIDETKKK